MVQTFYPQQGGTLSHFMSEGLNTGFQTGAKMFSEQQRNVIEEQRVQANSQYTQGLLQVAKQKQVLEAYQTARDMVGATLTGDYGDMSPSEVEMITKTGLQGTGLPQEAIDAYGKIARGNSEFAQNFRKQMRDTFDDPTTAAQFEAATRAGGVAGGMKFLDWLYKQRQDAEKAKLDQNYRQAQIEHEQAQTYRQYNPPARASGGGGGAGRGKAATPSYLKTTLWDETGAETEGFIDRETGIVHVIENGRLVPLNQAGQAPQPQSVPQVPSRAPSGAIPQAPEPRTPSVPQAPARAPSAVPQAPGPQAMPQAPGPQTPTGPQAAAPQGPTGTTPAPSKYTTTKPGGGITGTEAEAKNAGWYERAVLGDRSINEFHDQHPDFLEEKWYDLGKHLDAAELSGVRKGIPAVKNLPENWFLGDDAEVYRAAFAPFVSAALRKDTGAQINAEEWGFAMSEWIPLPGDSKEKQEYKRRNREAAIAGFYTGAGKLSQKLPKYQPYVPQPKTPAQPKAPVMSGPNYGPPVEPR